MKGTLLQPPRKFNSSQKNDGWKTILSWVVVSNIFYFNFLLGAKWSNLINMDVSENSGVFPPNHPLKKKNTHFGDTPIFWETPIFFKGVETTNLHGTHWGVTWKPWLDRTSRSGCTMWRWEEMPMLVMNQCVDPERKMMMMMMMMMMMLLCEEANKRDDPKSYLSVLSWRKGKKGLWLHWVTPPSTQRHEASWSLLKNCDAVDSWQFSGVAFDIPWWDCNDFYGGPSWVLNSLFFF